jgi:hypothetical protein
MSRRGRRAAARGTSAPAGGRRWFVVAAAVTVVALASLGIRSALERARPAARTEPSLTPLVLQDSARVALDARDWPRLAQWLDRLLVFEPRNSVYLRDQAVALHNIAWLGITYGRERTATRTSLERIAAEAHALALLDSSMAWSEGLQDWALSRDRAGAFYETLGLPLDALAIYADLRQRDPGYQPILGRVSYLTNLLRDPLRAPAAGTPATLDVRAR